MTIHDKYKLMFRYSSSPAEIIYIHDNQHGTRDIFQYSPAGQKWNRPWLYYSCIRYHPSYTIVSTLISLDVVPRKVHERPWSQPYTLLGISWFGLQLIPWNSFSFLDKLSFSPLASYCCKQTKRETNKKL